MAKSKATTSSTTMPASISTLMPRVEEQGINPQIDGFNPYHMENLFLETIQNIQGAGNYQDSKYQEPREALNPLEILIQEASTLKQNHTTKEPVQIHIVPTPCDYKITTADTIYTLIGYSDGYSVTSSQNGEPLIVKALSPIAAFEQFGGDPYQIVAMRQTN